jgi:hypothetical protein
MFDFLQLLFEGDVRPVKELFRPRGGPRCIRHLAWGNGIKPLYKDSWHALRKAVYQVFQYAVRHSNIFPPSPAAEFFVGMSTMKNVYNDNRLMPESSRTPFVVLVSRNNSNSLDNRRKILGYSESLIIDLFRKRGVPAATCCRFAERDMSVPNKVYPAGTVSTLGQLLSFFGFADICMGVHGAGLSNCVLANANTIVFEFQDNFNYGFTGFAKVVS